MAKQTNDLRESLLATLPQPENLATYREETAALLAKHQKAVNWDKHSKDILYACAFGVLLLCMFLTPRRHLDLQATHTLEVCAAMMWFVGAIYDVRYRIYDSQVANLKEIKQVQLQVLELQASFRREE